MTQQQRIARNTALAVIGVAGAGVVRFAFTLVTGRAFGAAELGVIAVVIAVATIATIPAAGVGAAGNRFLAVATGAKDPDMRAATLGSTWRGSLVVIGAALVGSWVYLEAQSLEIDRLTLLLGLGFVLAYGLYLTAKGVLFGDGHAARYAVGEVAGLVAFTFAIVLAAAFATSAGWMLASQILWASGVVAAAFLVGVGPSHLRGSAPSGLWSFASTSTIGSLLSLGVTQATVLVMAAFHGSTEAGLLAAAVAITAPLYLLPRGLSLALTPSMSFHVGAGAERRADLDAVYTTTLLVLFGAATAVAIIALEGLVLSAYGSGFGEATDFVIVFAIASFVAITGIPVVNRYASAGSRPLAVTVVASGIGAIAAGAIWWTLGRDEPVWIALGFLASAIIKVGIPFAMSRRVLGTLLVPPVGLTIFSIACVALSIAPDPWPWIALAVLALASLPILIVATARHRADVAQVDRSRPLCIGVITNMYPMASKPNLGIFVRDRVEAYDAARCDTVVVAPRRSTGATKYALLAIDLVRSLLTGPIPDVWEVHPTQPMGVYGAFAAWMTRRPFVLYAHGGDIPLVPGNRVVRSLVDGAVRSADEIHANSQATANAVERRWHPECEILVIPPGVPMPANDHSPERDIDVLFVGNLIERKGVDVLIQAVSRIDDIDNCVVIGDGPDRSQLEEAAASDDRVHFTGLVAPEDVRAWMARAHVVAVPSRAEPLGQVAIEALSVGTPVVVSDVGGLSEIPDERSGSVVPPDDPDALAGGIDSWLQAMRERPDAVADAAMARASDYALDVVAAQAIDRFAAMSGRAESAIDDGSLRDASID